MLKKYCLGVVVFLILNPLLGVGQDAKSWQVKSPAIKTKWADQVDFNRPLPEYPRPQMVRKSRWENLNGLWNYAITHKEAPMPVSYQGKILVPYPIESALSGVMHSLTPLEALWYQRSINVDNRKNERLLLHFGAVDWQAIVYVNGVIVGNHAGGYTEFTVDITEYVKTGSNILVVKVFDPTERGIGPHGKQLSNPQNIYYTASSGIWQTVWIESVPNNYIRSLILIPNVDNESLEVSANAPDGFSLRVEVMESDKKVVSASGNTSGTVRMRLKNAKLWSPESPFLYKLKVSLVRGDRIIDQVDSYFGMRKVSIEKDSAGFDRIFLNNKYYYNLGALDQGFWPEGIYTAPTDSALQFDIIAMKAMGFNTIRKHIKVEPARWYYYADSIGMLVWQDMINPNQLLTEEGKVQFENECKEIVKQLHNYPCITTWVLFNEKWGAYDQKRLTEWLKATDPLRLVNGHSGEFLYVNNVLRSPSSNAYVSADLTDVHSYPMPKLAVKLPGKAQVCGEFGGIGVFVENHVWDDLIAGWGYNGLNTPEMLERQFEDMVDTLCMLEKRGQSASIYTQPFDVESELNGLLTYDRRVSKLPVDVIRRIHGKLISPGEDVLQPTLSYLGTPDMASYSYEIKLSEFKNGRSDSAFLRALALMAEKRKDTLVSRAASDVYIQSIKSPFAKENLRFIKMFTKNSTAEGFRFIYNNRKAVNEILGENEAENIVMGIIYKEEIAPYDKLPNPDWDLIERKVVAKYGELGQERVWGNRMVYSASIENWTDFAKYYKLYFDKVIPLKRSFVHINNLSWPIFEHISDTSVLKTAIRATKFNIEHYVGDDPYAIDTYANLLYKFGRKEEAIGWQQRAVQMSGGDRVLRETLEKMQTGVPTW